MGWQRVGSGMAFLGLLDARRQSTMQGEESLVRLPRDERVGWREVDGETLNRRKPPRLVTLALVTDLQAACGALWAAGQVDQININISAVLCLPDVDNNRS